MGGTHVNGLPVCLAGSDLETIGGPYRGDLSGPGSRWSLLSNFPIRLFVSIDEDVDG
jgi:hypothetical protein